MNLEKYIYIKPFVFNTTLFGSRESNKAQRNSSPLTERLQLFSFLRTLRLLLYFVMISTILPLCSKSFSICVLASVIWSFMILDLWMLALTSSDNLLMSLSKSWKRGKIFYHLLFQNKQNFRTFLYTHLSYKNALHSTHSHSKC